MVWLFVVLFACTGSAMAGDESTYTHRTILAVGAHAGDMEVTAGALLARHTKAGDRAVLLHLTLGEGGNPRLTPEQYGQQKRREAEAAARVLRAETMFGPYKDGELPDNEGARRYVADVIRQVRPTHIITHWGKSLHKDHSAAHAIVTDAILLAALPGVKSEYPAHNGVRMVLFAENWEDQPEFHPYTFIDVSDALTEWEKSVTQYEFIRGGISKFPYLDYYRALFKVRGAEGGFVAAECFDIEPWEKKQTLRSLP